MKVTRRKILFGVVLLLALLALVPVVAHYRMKAAVAAYQKQLRAQSEKLTIAELIPPTPTNGPNGAAALLSAASRLSPLDLYQPSHMKAVAPGHARVAWTQDILADDQITNLWPGLRLAVQKGEPVFQEIQDALESPVLQFDLNYHQGFRLTLPHLAPLKGCAQWLSGATTAELHDGHVDAAWDKLRACTTLPTAWKDEPLMICQLVRYAIVAIAFANTWEALQFPGWTDTQLGDLQAEWQAMNFIDVVELTLSMERVLGEEAFTLARGSYDAVGSIAAIGSAASGSSNVFSHLVDIGKEMFDDPKSALKNFSDRYPRYWAWKWWWSYDEELFLKQSWQIGLDSARLAKTQKSFAPALKQFQEASDRLIKMHPHVPERSIFGDFDVAASIYSFLRKVALAESQKEMLVTAIALNRYRLRHGTFPTELSALVPELMSALPNDLIDGKPLRYRLKDEGQFVLYSVGENGVDDGGDPTPKTKTSSKHMSYGRDWVWPTPATPDEIATDNAAMAKLRMAMPRRMQYFPQPTNPPGTNAAK